MTTTAPIAVLGWDVRLEQVPPEATLQAMVSNGRPNQSPSPC
jgi:hypothetical protein